MSELLQSQLLQPINITPIQPRLAESNLFISSAEGPSSLSFNEFNPLFNRNRIALLANGIVGNNDTFGEEVVVSGLYNKASFSIGQNYYKTDGVRENNDLKDKIYNAFFQYNLFPRTSVQAEYRYRDNTRGDTELLFWNNNISVLRQEEEKKSFRVGFLQSFSPQSNLIGNFSYTKRDAGVFYKFFIDPAIIDFPPPDIVDAFTDITSEKAYTGELQHIYRAKYISTIVGAGYFKIDQDITLSDIFTWPGETPPLLLLESADNIDFDISHINIYLYSNIKPFETLTLTVGASGDFFKMDESDRDDRDLEKKPVQSEIRRDMEPFLGYNRSRRGVQDTKEDVGYRPDPRAHPGGRLQSVFR